MATALSTPAVQNELTPSSVSVNNSSGGGKTIAESALLEFHKQLMQEGVAVLQVTTKKGTIYEGEIQHLDQNRESITLINYRLLTTDEGIEMENSPAAREVCIDGSDIAEMKMMNPNQTAAQPGDVDHPEAAAEARNTPLANKRNGRAKRNNNVPRTFVRQSTDTRRRSFPTIDNRFYTFPEGSTIEPEHYGGSGRRNRQVHTSIMISDRKVVPAFRLYSGRAVQSFLRYPATSYNNSFDAIDNNSSFMSSRRTAYPTPRFSAKKMQRDAQRLERLMADVSIKDAVSPKVNYDTKDKEAMPFYDPAEFQEQGDPLPAKHDTIPFGQMRYGIPANKNAYNSRTFGPMRNFDRGYYRY
jgi:hypothetical protein